MAKVIHLSEEIRRREKREKKFISSITRGLRWVVAVPFFSVALGLGLWVAVLSGISSTMFWLGRRIAGDTPNIRFCIRLTLPGEDA